MHTRGKRLLQIGLLLVGCGVVVGLALLTLGALEQPTPALAAQTTAQQTTRPAVAPATTLPATTCTPGPGVGERTCDLYAMTGGSLTMPDGTIVPVWGYNDTGVGTPQVPGPTLIANQGETLTVILHNTLATTTSLNFPGQFMAPDLTGVAAGGTITYSFVVTAGTYLYEAGLTPDGPRQVAMGLFGAIVVRPAVATQVYNDPNTQFTDEALLVFHEIDPAFNANPAGFDLRLYSARYWLINGQAYPQTAPIAVTGPGVTVALRMVSAGVEHQDVGVAGLDQTFVGANGQPLQYSYQLGSDMMATGQTRETLVQIPISATAGSQFPLYDTALHLHNANQHQGSPTGPLAYGGQLAFLNVPGVLPFINVGPLAGNMSLVPNPVTSPLGSMLTAFISDVSTGGDSVVAAEYFTDTVGAPGTGVPMTGPFGSVNVTVSANIPPSVTTALAQGVHVVYVRGQDTGLRWGALNSIVLNALNQGPLVSGIGVQPSPTNGSVDVGVGATADASAAPGVNVTAAEYFIDTQGVTGTGRSMVLNMIAPIVSLTDTITSSIVTALPEGIHPLWMHAQDSAGLWGSVVTANLLVDKTGPATLILTTTPSVFSSTMPVEVRLDGDVADPLVAGVNSNLSSHVEGFIDTPGATNKGFPLMAVDGSFDNPEELVYYNLPIPTLQMLAQGTHHLYVHGQDSAGNWGVLTSTTASVTFVVTKGVAVDTAGPLIGEPVAGLGGVQAQAVQCHEVMTMSVTAADPGYVSNIVGAEWWIGSDPGPGNGTPMRPADGVWDSTVEVVVADIDVSSDASGTQLAISMRAKDDSTNGPGTWGPVSTQSLVVARSGVMCFYLPVIGH
jgi:hypothetical protein